jgi:hypothetical protein
MVVQSLALPKVEQLGNGVLNGMTRVSVGEHNVLDDR